MLEDLKGLAESRPCSYRTRHLSARGRVTLLERPAAPQEVGRATNAVTGMLIVGLVHDGRMFSFYEDARRTIEEGDVLIVIESTRAPRTEQA
jgi:voltage-gated potassium channel